MSNINNIEEVIHRRVHPNSDNIIDIFRLTGKCKDVETVNQEYNIVVRNGNSIKARYGGLSVNRFHPDQYSIEDCSTPIYENYLKINNGKPIKRWHCYKRNMTLRPFTCYNINYDKDNHGVIYPLNEIEVINRHQHSQTGEELGRFPGINDNNWEFCCNLLQIKPDDYMNLKAGAEPIKFSDFKDDDFNTLIYILDLFSFLNEWCDDDDIYVEVIEFIKSLDRSSKFSHSIFPREVLNKILYLLDSFTFISVFVEDVDRAQLLISKLTESNESHQFKGYNSNIK